MKSFARLACLLAAACAVALVAVPGVTAAVKHNHRSTTAGHANVVDTTGGVITTAGAAKDNLFGDVAVVIKTRASGSQLKGTAVEYTRVGIIRSTISITFKANPDGSSSYTGTGKETGGTGRFVGVTGSYSLTATQPKATGSPLTFKTTGNLRF